MDEGGPHQGKLYRDDVLTLVGEAPSGSGDAFVDIVGDRWPAGFFLLPSGRQREYGSRFWLVRGGESPRLVSSTMVHVV